jgi:hypothetical protein
VKEPIPRLRQPTKASSDNRRRNTPKIAVQQGASARLSEVSSCKINGVDPFAYLVATLEAIAAGHPKSRIDDLTPWAFQAASTSQP